jgi:uncharacterized protein YndB with AHSA1/START domain
MTDGTVTRAGDAYELRFERRLPYEITRVWAALTEPDELARWLAQPSRALTSAGNYEFRFDDSGDTARGEITRIEAPTLLAGCRLARPPGRARRGVERGDRAVGGRGVAASAG